MRTPIAIAIACIAFAISADAAPATCVKSYKVVVGDTVRIIYIKLKVTRLLILNTVFLYCQKVIHHFNRVSFIERCR